MSKPIGRLVATIDTEPQLGVQAVCESLDVLSLPLDEYLILGGANLVLRGVKPTTPDIDLLVSNGIFNYLLELDCTLIKEPPLQARINGAVNQTAWVKTERTPLPVSATTSLGDGYYPMTFEGFRDRTEQVRGYTCSMLEDVQAAKEALQRPKDLVDLQHIAKFTGKTISMRLPAVYDTYESP